MGKDRIAARGRWKEDRGRGGNRLPKTEDLGTYSDYRRE